MSAFTKSLCAVRARSDSFHNRSFGAFLCAGAGAAAMFASVGVSAEPVYVTLPNGSNFCFEQIPPDPCPPIEPIVVEDGCLGVTFMGNGMGDTQSVHTVTNGSLAEPICGIAIAVTDDAAVTLSDDGVSEFWQSAIVSRNEWNAGFQFEGSAGAWQPIQTNGTFDALFGAEFDLVAVYWASTNFSTAPIGPDQTVALYVGPQRVLSPEIPAGFPYVLFGDGVILQTGGEPVRAIDQFGLTHTAIDGATLEVDAGGRLKVSNLGSSGCDGVSIDLGEGEGWGVLPLPPVIAPGSSVKSSFNGRVNAVDNTPVLITCLEGAVGPGFRHNLIFDFDLILPGQVRIDLFDDNGVIVGGYDTTSPASVSLDGLPPGTPIRAICEPGGDVGLFATGGLVDVFDPSSGTTFPGVALISATAVNTAATVDFISDVVITGVNIPELVFIDEEIQKFGLFESALGDVKFDTTGGKLKVSNLGSSGCDGFSIVLPDDTEQFEMRWLPLDPCAGIFPPPPGCDPFLAFFELHSTGIVGGLPNQQLGTLRVSNDEGATGFPSVRIEADYSPVGSPTQQLEIYSGGLLVDIFTGHPNGPVAVATDWPKGCGKGAVEIGGVDTACYVICWDQPQQIQIPGLPPVLGDELRVLAENPAAPFEALQSFEFFGAEIPEIDLTSIFGFGPPPCPADLDGDGNVGAFDLAILLGAWGPDPQGVVDLDGDGNVGASDYAIVLGSWGPCP